MTDLATRSTPLRVAAVQAEPKWLDLDAGVSQVIDLIAEAARRRRQARRVLRDVHSRLPMVDLAGLTGLGDAVRRPVRRELDEP
jgi:hypothetical protein